MVALGGHVGRREGVEEMNRSEPIQVQPEQTDIARERASDGLRILIVDDNTASTRILEIMISKLGRHVLATSNSGKEAIETARRFRPQLVFLDMLLGDMSGLDVIGNLREVPGFETTLFVAVTGKDGDDDRRRTADAGFAMHLAKPVSIASIEQVLERCRGIMDGLASTAHD